MIHRRPAKGTPKRAPVPPGVALLVDQGGFHDQPFGTSGEMLPAAQPEAAPPPPRPFVIDSPDWEAEARERRERDGGTAGPSRARSS